MTIILIRLMILIVIIGIAGVGTWYVTNQRFSQSKQKRKRVEDGHIHNYMHDGARVRLTDDGELIPDESIGRSTYN